MTTVKVGGKDIELRECPECHREVISLIREFKAGKIVRTFCHFCGDAGTATTVTKKIQEHAVAGTLDQYPLAERLADLSGKNFVKVKQDKPN